MQTHRSDSTRAVMAVVALCAALVLVGCGGPQRIPPSSPPSSSSLSGGTASGGAPPGGQAPPGTTAVKLDPKYPYVTFANRGIEGWKASPASDGSSLTCGFRAAKGAGAHYGGVGVPLPGSKGFSLTVTFKKGASAVKSVFVTALSGKGEPAGRWGYAVRTGGGRLVDGTPYTWEFGPGRGTPGKFWAIPGTASSRLVVHFFLDVDPGQEVSFRIDKVESQG
jgi:hypothetical protein